jgi:1,2-phenylacetyl-CoA epoxidase PaaB subunit
MSLSNVSTNCLEKVLLLLDSDSSDDELVRRYLKKKYDRGEAAIPQKRTWSKQHYKTQQWQETKLWYSITCKNTVEIISDPKSRDYKTFKRRYRMGYPIFQQFMKFIQPAVKHLETKQSSDIYQSPPLELKVLATLRYLGRGITFDDISECIGIGEETLRVFARKFCKAFSEQLYSTHIDYYENDPGTHPTNNVSTYRTDLPGCIGSVDSVHIIWERCPAMLSNSFTGRYGRPTLAYNVTSDHSRRILSSTCGFDGSKNDKSIVLFDRFVNRIRSERSFTHFEYSLCSAANGALEMHRGVYLLCDGGYRIWRVLQAPTRYSSDEDEKKFSASIESYRKDIECTFGILKKRFRILKHPLLVKRKSDCDAIFLTCCTHISQHSS